MVKFEYIDVPESWQQYFSKYPNGLSLLEALIEWVSQVDNITATTFRIRLFTGSGTPLASSTVLVFFDCLL